MCLEHAPFLSETVLKDDSIHHIPASKTSKGKNRVLSQSRPIQKIRRPQQAVAALAAIAGVFAQEIGRNLQAMIVGMSPGLYRDVSH